MDDRTDAFGRALMDWAHGGTDPEVYERDDGFVDVGAGHELFVAGYQHWPSPERQAMRYVRGRVIDVGCGGGRVALHLQERGFAVVGLDVSSLAAETTSLRGVKETWCLSIHALTQRIHEFDTVVLFGNNFGIFGTPERLQRTLAQWARRLPPKARILAESTSPYGGGAPGIDRAYTRRNRQRGLMPGQTRLRVRYHDWATPWFPWLFVSTTEMRSLLRETGWHQERTLATTSGEPYVAVLEKD